jgi:hypothetical protein
MSRWQHSSLMPHSNLAVVPSCIGNQLHLPGLDGCRCLRAVRNSRAPKERQGRSLTSPQSSTSMSHDVAHTVVALSGTGRSTSQKADSAAEASQMTST